MPPGPGAGPGPGPGGIFVYLCIFLYFCVYLCIYVYIYVYLCIFMYIYIYIYIWGVGLYILTRKDSFKPEKIPLNMHKNTNMYTNIQKCRLDPAQGRPLGPAAFLYICVYFCMFVYICVFMCICMYICVYLCIFAYIMLQYLSCLRYMCIFPKYLEMKFQDLSRQGRLEKLV